MDAETSFSSIPPLVFDGENYQLWAVRMETYLEALDLWEAMEEDYEVPPLQTILPWPRSKITRKERPGNQRPKHVCLLEFQQPFSRELCLSKQQKLFGIISRKSMMEMKG